MLITHSKHVFSGFFRVHLPGQVDDKEENIAISYDCDTGVCHVQLQKRNQGESFEGLDMITSLMAIPKISNNRGSHPLLQEQDDVKEDCKGREQEEDEGDDDLEWFLESVKPEEGEDWLRQNLLGERYGFANSKQKIFNRMGDEVALAVDVKDPDLKPASLRRKERIQEEDSRFDEEYYLSCLFDEDDQLQRILKFRPFWAESEQEIQFSELDLFDMKNLSAKKYILDKQEKKEMLLSLIDILFGFCYDIRVNEGEDCSESHWNISKLSSTLSWLETFSSMNEVVVACLRRSQIYPLVRHYDLSVQCLKDVEDILRLGRKLVVKSLLIIRRIFIKNLESKYILNDLYINDFCVWIQRVDNSTLEKVANSLNKTLKEVKKTSLGLDLDLLEAAARLSLEEKEGTEGK